MKPESKELLVNAADEDEEEDGDPAPKKAKLGKGKAVAKGRAVGKAALKGKGSNKVKGCEGISGPGERQHDSSSGAKKVVRLQLGYMQASSSLGKGTAPLW